MSDVMEELFDRQIVSVFVEGGAKLHQTFLETGLWDEARVFTGKMLFTQGVKAPEINEEVEETVRIGKTKLEVYRNKFNDL
jgi:diaminohydroxyphosphoribosylaminopyrimidine deaminase/5-amino-6-(5-phosphoribosylamino)uracil reductase